MDDYLAQAREALQGGDPQTAQVHALISIAESLHQLAYPPSPPVAYAPGRASARVTPAQEVGT